jgi:hypothetical protein
MAFRFSESDLRHWLLLLLADRVNVVEGVAAEVNRGWRCCATPDSASIRN